MLNKTELKNDIWNTLKQEIDAKDEDMDGNPTPLQKVCEIIANKIVKQIVDNLEVKGITVNLDTGPRTIETFTLGVGDHGGSLSSLTGGTVAGSVKDAKNDTGTQSNDGTGRVL